MTVSAVPSGFMFDPDVRVEERIVDAVNRRGGRTVTVCPNVVVTSP